MKKIILSLAVVSSVQGTLNAQAVNDTVATGAGYSNNVWYSLANDDAGTAAENNWHIALGASANPSAPLAAAAQFNRTLGQIYVFPDLEVADFNDADTAGLSTWTPLQNDEYSWAGGAMNNASGGAPLDYGFGAYNTVSHSVEANRVFFIKPATGNVGWKFMLTLESVAGNWKVTYSRLDNSDSATLTIPLAGFQTKNFVYVNFVTDAAVDREPAASSWDLWFGRYNYPLWYTSPFAPQTQTGVLTNLGVEAIQVDGIDPSAYDDYLSQEWITDSINVIGADWKAFSGGVYVIDADRVYFIDDVDGNIWKVVMTYFSGTSAGKYGFSKEKVGSVGLNENGENIFASLYPNPAADRAAMVLKNVNGKIDVYSTTGSLVYSQDVNVSGMTAVELPVADFSNGAYQVVCTSGSAVSTQRLIVQH